jgi:hypothetical protein
MGRRAAARVFTILAGIILALTVGAAAGCDPGHGVTYDNRTGQRVTVFQDGVREFVLEVSERKTYTEFLFSGSSLFEAKDDKGTVLYSELLTWDELKERGWEIVITTTRSPPEVVPPQSPSPSPR